MPKYFGKVLIANRGEIAVRAIRSLKELGIRTVAIYSEADKGALHRYLADEAYLVGGPRPEDSYLNIDNVIRVAKKCGAEAIYPGYGFLSQNPYFVKRCEEEGLTFIGPPVRIHEFVSNKVRAKKHLYEKGIPVIPGPLDPLRNVDEALKEAEKLGYPIILKPVFGGGGIGMKVCLNERELRDYFDSLSKISEGAFGAGELYIEKFFPQARHLEVQILADHNGNVIHLYERECTLQRRFQKVVEEAPSPALNDEGREELLRLGVRVAKLVKYVNVGTVEFIYVPTTGDFYFMELNARIQVEHPVTEAITGVDIVKEQVKIASGEGLNLGKVSKVGHAFEVRVYAEDPFDNFKPCPGVISHYIPPGGPWVRVDSGVYPGYEMPPYYDPLIAKLVTWGKNRLEALNRMR
ncbi:MAG: pyruvate carboxylase subunit A, partial [Thermofilum sp. ex4484_15]